MHRRVRLAGFKPAFRPMFAPVLCRLKRQAGQILLQAPQTAQTAGQAVKNTIVDKSVDKS